MTVSRKSDRLGHVRAQKPLILAVIETVQKGGSSVAGFFLGRARSAERDSATPQGREEQVHLLMRRGRVAGMHGDLPMALSLFEEALRMLPDHTEAVEARAEALDMLGETASAGAAFDRYRELNASRRLGAPDRHYVWRHPRPSRADVLAYELVLRRVKKRLYPLIAQGNLLLSLGHPEAAIGYFDDALQLNGSLPEVKVLRACALMTAGKYVQAISALDAVLGAEPDDADALNTRGIAHMANGQVSQANADWSRQFDLLPESRASARACIALRMADYERALPEFEKALAREPGDPYWQLYRATAERRLGQAVRVAAPDAGAAWPAPLLALHAGTLDEAAVMARADNRQRRIEALFQLAVLAAGTDADKAAAKWREVMELAPVDMIEYAAARNELARLGN